MKSRDIVILHGWNLSSKRFEPLSSLFKKQGYRVFSPDFPGFGDEPAPTVPWHIWDYAVFLEKYLKSHSVQTPLLIGHSFGGRVSLAYTSKHPKDVRGLILTGAPGFSPVPRNKMLFFMVLAKVGGIAFSLPLIRIFADAARKALYRVAGAHEFYRAEGAMRQTFKYVVQDDLRPFMETIHVPTLLLWGENDTIVPPEVAVRMQTVIPKSSLKVVPGETHAFPFQNPKRFISMIQSFL